MKVPVLIPLREVCVFSFSESERPGILVPGVTENTGSSERVDGSRVMSEKIFQLKKGLSYNSLTDTIKYRHSVKIEDSFLHNTSRVYLS